MSRFIGTIEKVDKVLYVIAGGTLVLMVLLTLTDVILRNFGHPITGSMEIIQYGGSIVFGFSVPYATFLKAQVRVDLILARLKPAAQKRMSIATRIIGIAFFLFAAYNFYLYARDAQQSGEVTASFRIPFYPIIYSLGFSFLCQALTVAVDLIATLKGAGASAAAIAAGGGRPAEMEVR